MIRRFPRAAALAVALLACRSGDPDAAAVLRDDAGRPIASARPMRRIVSLAPNLTELFFDLGVGDRLVGRTRWCTYPPDALRVPSVGDGLDPNVEMIVALEPEWVVFYASPSNDHAIQQLARLGIATLSLRTDRFADLGRAARLLGRLADVPRVADSLANDLEREIALLEATAPRAAGPAVVILAWNDPPIVIGGGSFLSEIVTLAGARNVFGDIDRPSATVSIETIAERNPDLVIVPSDSGIPEWAQRPEWEVIPAVRAGRFVTVSGSEFERPSSRGPAAARRLRAALVGESR